MSLDRSKAMLELGRRLVRQLEAADDLLASWTAHYVSELMVKAENAKDESRAAAQRACFDAILALWQHIHALPEHLRPFADVEPVLRTLATLDEAQSEPRYFPRALQEAALEKADEDTRQWLEVAFETDFAARTLIHFALREAAQRGVTGIEDWIDIAYDADVEMVPIEVLRDFVTGATDKSDAADALHRAALEAKIKRLEHFSQLAATLSAELKERLPND